MTMRNYQARNIDREIPVLAPPIRPEVQKDSTRSDLRVVVLYRTPELTKEALQYGAKLGSGLSVNFRLVEIEVVPFPCPLNQPTIDPTFARGRLEKLAEESGLPIRAELVYARDREEALNRLLGAASVVLIPVKGVWRQFSERRLMRNLIKQGHDVILVPCN
jgi:hypothetical protein